MNEILDDLVVSIKTHEGFEGNVYEDHLGYETVGYGTKMPISRKEATVLLRMRLSDKIEALKKRKPVFAQLPAEAQKVLAEMAYQLGVAGLLKFKKTWEHLENHDFYEASAEGLDSLWARQTPKRAKELMERLSKA